MKADACSRKAGPGRARRLFLWGLLLALWGCQAQEPPLTPAEAAFKNEVKVLVARLSPLLAEPVGRRSLGEINVVLQQTFMDPKNLPQVCPFKIVIADKHGVTIGKYPVERGFGVDFSAYDVVQRVLQDGKTAQGRFYLQDGTRIYVICAPLRKEDQVVGLLALWADAQEVGMACGLPEGKFLALDFEK